MRRWARDNGLGLAFGLIFLATLTAQALVGHTDFNHQQLAHQDETISLWRYVTSSSFGVDVMENWQSEYLQFSLYVLATVWLVQRGSTESKQPGDEGTEDDRAQLVGRHAQRDSPAWARAGGWRTGVYGRSLLMVMTAIWLLSWLATAVCGRVAYNADQFDHHEAALSLWQYAGSSDFWNRTLQNWQSEFLAVGSFAVFTVFLRQRGSSESKPVGTPHAETGAESS